MGDPGSDLYLTPREQQILDGVKRGLDNRRIAEELGIATQSVKDYVSVLLSKFGVANRTRLARIATRMDLVGQREVSERLLRKLFKDAPFGIAQLSGQELRFILANAAFSRFAGGRELAGSFWHDAMPGMPQLEAALRRVVATGQRLDRERIAVVRTAGEPTAWAHAVAERLIGEIGEADSVVLFMTDVTEHIRARDRVAELTTTRSVLADLVPHGVVIVDRERRVIVRNARARAFGSADEVVVDADLLRERAVRAASTGRLVRPEGDQITKALRGETTPHSEYLYRRPTTGEVFRLSVSAQPLHDADGNVNAALIVFDVLGP